MKMTVFNGSPRGRNGNTHVMISDDTISHLEKPIISYNQYIRGANQNWDKLLSKSKIKMSMHK